MAVREKDLPDKAGKPSGAIAVSSIWYTRCPVPTASGIAQHFRWIHQAFEREGVEVRALQESSDPAERRSHYTHTLPASFREGGNIPAIWAKALGADVG